MKALALLFLCLITYSGFAQKADNIKSKYISIDLISPFYTPLTLHNNSSPTPRWRVGYLTRTQGRWAIGGTLGLGIEGFMPIETKKDYRLVELSIATHYFLSANLKWGHTISFQGMALYHSEELKRQVYITNGNDAIFFDRADYSRWHYSFALKYNLIIPIVKKLKLLMSFGGGAKVWNNQYKNEINPKIELYPNESSDFQTRESLNEEGFGDFGLSLFYAI